LALLFALFVSYKASIFLHSDSRNQGKQILRRVGKRRYSYFPYHRFFKVLNL